MQFSQNSFFSSLEATFASHAETDEHTYRHFAKMWNRVQDIQKRVNPLKTENKKIFTIPALSSYVEFRRKIKNLKK